MNRNLETLLPAQVEFLFIFRPCVDNCKQNLFLERKVGVTERSRSLNPRNGHLPYHELLTDRLNSTRT